MKAISGLLGALGLFLLLGCGSADSAATANIFVIDYSGSTDDVRKSYLGHVLMRVETLPIGSPVTILRLGKETQEVFGGQIDETSVDTIATSLKQYAWNSDPMHGTNFLLLKGALEKLAVRYLKQNLCVYIYTDGGNDSPGSFETIRPSSHRRITFIGVEPQFKSGLESSFPGSTFMSLEQSLLE